MNITAAPYTATSSGYGYPSISDSPASPSRNRQPPLEDLAARTAPAAATDPAAPDRTASAPRNAGQTSENREAGSAQNQESRDQQAAAGNDTTRVNGRELSQEEVRLLEQLKQIDAEVKRHEMAHVSAGGQYIRSGANFTYKQGPDGRNYAVGGEVSIDTSPIPGDPQATLKKMRQVRAAALAPADPSPQDLKVASQASASATKALSELMLLQAEKRTGTNDSTAFGNLRDAARTYEQISGIPDETPSTFRIAV